MPKRTVRPIAIDSGGHRAAFLARRDDLVRDHLSLAEGIARSIARTLPPCFDLDDLIAAGNLALIHAATRFRPQDHEGVPFNAYARKWIAGGILETVRRNRYLEATRPGLDDVRAEARPDPRAVAPDALIDANARVVELRRAVASLPPAERRLVRAYYGPAELTMREASRRARVSDADGRKLHVSALAGLRERLKEAA